uniref:Osiris 18 n=1 Tax=Heliothis virescens TaxID=7102 RepID=A0A2A4JEX8_HELVI
MRPLTALLVLAACHCACAHQPQTPRERLDSTLRSLLGEHYSPVQRILSCTYVLGTTKCLSALSTWRAERAITAYAKDPATRFNLTEDVEQFPWLKYSNITDEQLYSQLYDDTRKLLRYRPLDLNLIPGYNLHLGSKGNGSVKIDIYTSDDTSETGRSSIKKLKKYAYRFAPLMLVPGLVMSAIFPFILPGLKMMTLMVGMMNNMALMGAVFTMLRNNAFNDKYEHKVVYVNSGYDNEKYYAAANTEEHIHTNHIGSLFDDSKRPLRHEDHGYGEDFDSTEELPALSVNPEWLKAYADGKMFAIIGKDQHNKKH